MRRFDCAGGALGASFQRAALLAQLSAAQRITGWLSNERVREELRSGASPQMAISAGYERAWATILDSNITTLIAGLALFAFGAGPVKGFAVVLCLGIVTSIFSAVVVSRGLMNLYYGGRRKLTRIHIG